MATALAGSGHEQLQAWQPRRDNSLDTAARLLAVRGALMIASFVATWSLLTVVALYEFFTDNEMPHDVEVVAVWLVKVLPITNSLLLLRSIRLRSMHMANSQPSSSAMRGRLLLTNPVAPAIS